MVKHIGKLHILALASLVMLAACAPKGEALYARAEQSLEKDEPRAAAVDLQALVQAEPQNAKARALLATALIAMGNYSGGEIELDKARDLGATKEMLLLPSCQVLRHKGESEKVLTDCDPQTAPANLKAELHNLRGSALLGLSRATEAKEQFEAALAVEPDNIEAVLGLASAAFQLGGVAAAEAVMADATPKVKTQTRYWLAVASLRVEVKDFKGAEAAYQSGLDNASKVPDSSERLLAMGGLAEAQMRQGKMEAAEASTDKLAKAAPKNPLVKQLRAQVLIAGGKYEEARTILEKLVSDQPANYPARTLLAAVQVQQGNLDQAEMHLAAVVANEPDNAQAQSLLAQVRAKQGDQNEKSADLESALEQTGNDPAMLATAGRLSLASGNREQALAYLAQAAEKSGKGTSTQTQLDIANGYLVAGEYDRAIEILNALPESSGSEYQREYLLLLSLMRKGDVAGALSRADQDAKRFPDDARIRTMVASIYWAAGKPEIAREQMAAAQRLKPDSPEVILSVARMDVAQGRFAEAEAGFKRILDKDPKNLVATLGMAAAAGARKDKAANEKWLIKASTDHPDSTEAQLALGQYYVGNNDFAKGKMVMDDALKANPNSGAIANARGIMMLGARDLPGATTSFAEAVRREPSVIEYKLNLAKAQALSKDIKSAQASVESALKDHPDSLAALVLGSSVSLAAGDLERATGYVERARQVAPNSPTTYQLEGDLAMAQNKFKEAAGFYAKADPAGKSRNIVIARYIAAQRAGLADAQKILVDWLARNPGDSEVVSLLAEYKLGQGDEAGATALYEQALKAKPDDGVLLNNLAMRYLNDGDSRALAVAEKAYKVMPNQAATQDTYGWALFKAGKTDAAVDMLRTAAKSLPDNAEVQYHLAAALAKSGNKAEGLVNVRKALGGSLSPDVRADAQKLLADLSK